MASETDAAREAGRRSAAGPGVKVIEVADHPRGSRALQCRQEGAGEEGGPRRGAVAWPVRVEEGEGVASPIQGQRLQAPRGVRAVARAAHAGRLANEDRQTRVARRGVGVVRPVGVVAWGARLLGHLRKSGRHLRLRAGAAVAARAADPRLLEAHDVQARGRPRGGDAVDGVPRGEAGDAVGGQAQGLRRRAAYTPAGEPAEEAPSRSGRAGEGWRLRQRGRAREGRGGGGLGRGWERLHSAAGGAGAGAAAWGCGAAVGWGGASAAGGFPRRRRAAGGRAEGRRPGGVGLRLRRWR